MTSQIHPDDPGEPTTGVPRLSITRDEALILELLAAGKYVLEVGTGLAVSTNALAHSAVRVMTVDPDPWVHSTIWPYLPENVDVRSSLETVEGIFDMVFIDGDHEAPSVARDVEECLRRVAPGALIVAHDANYAEVAEGLGEGWYVIPTTHGLALKVV